MEAFYTAIWVAVFYSVYSFLAVHVLNARTDILFIVTAGLYFTMFLIRRFIKPVIPMFLAHIALICAVWFLSPDLQLLVMYFSMAILLSIFSMFQRYKRTQTFSTEFIIIASMFLIILTLVMGSQGHTHMYIHYTAILIFVIVGAKFHMRMYQFNLSLKAITQSTNQPVKKILYFDYKAMFVLSVVIIGLIIFFHVAFVRPALEATVSLLPDDLAFNIEDGPFQQRIMYGPVGGMPIISRVRDDAEPFLVWVILDWILVYIIMPALGLLALYGAFRWIINIYKLLGKNNSQVDKLTEGYEDEKEFILNPIPWFKHLLQHSHLNEHKIRRRFRETVVKQMKKGVPIESSDTPTQMAGKILLDDFYALAEEYAQVRYK